MPPSELTLQSLSARSVVISLLLGLHPARISPADATRAGEYFGIPTSTLRVALTRAVAAGDLARLDGDYVLGERQVARRRRQDEAVADAHRPWDGTWEMAVVVVSGRSGQERGALRDTLMAHRLGELREGVWTRPANLRRAAAYTDDPVVRTFRAEPDGDPVALAATLWDLVGWAATGRELLGLLEAATQPLDRLTVAAHIVRHLASDPLLPAGLLPRGWPGSDLRAIYARYQGELRSVAQQLVERDPAAPTA